jgi:drug/metabolite transporter (DMT)-like permease
VSRVATAWPARLLLLGGIWGMSFVLIKIGNRGFTPVQVSFGRMLFGLLALAPVLLAQRGRLPHGRDHGVDRDLPRARVRDDRRRRAPGRGADVERSGAACSCC